MHPEVFDYFAQVELPAPTLAAPEVQRLFLQHFGVEVEATSLGSQQDQNFVVFAPESGRVLGVLKLTNPVFSEAEIEMQDAAAARVSERHSGLRIPRVVRGPNGLMSSWWDSSQGRIHGRVLEHVAGSTLMGSGYLPPRVVARMGELAGLVSIALADFSHPADGRVLQWDLRHARRVIDLLLPSEPDAAVRRLVATATAIASRVLDVVGPLLRVQAGHFDVTDDNVLRADPESVPDAVIDFGDVASSWAVGEIAVTVSSILHHDGAVPSSVLPAIQAFHAVRRLDENEIEALWALVIMRGAVLVLSGRQQDRLDEQNTYAHTALDRELRILEQAASVPPEVMAAIIRANLGMSPRPRDPWKGGRLLAPAENVVELDAGTTSPLNDEGAWMRHDSVEEAALAALDGGADVVYLPGWRPLLSGAPARTPSSPTTVPTATTVWLGSETTIAGGNAVEARDGSLTVTAGDQSVIFSSPSITARGAELPPRTPITVWRSPSGAWQVPAKVAADMAAGWHAVLGDVADALGLKSLVFDSADQALARRESVLAEVQEHYYDRPPQIERGWREFLIDTNARVYLDMVNNVASVGHAHPHLVAAACDQMRLLNTNSRFHYRAIADYAERMASTLPAELDTVFFVNSGSEATDLAIRLAMAFTGRPDIVAMREAYHGWTYASDAVSTSVADNPNALSTRPSWVHTVAAANSYRGAHRGADAWRYAAEAIQFIESMGAKGRPPAGFICESYFGNAGGVALPDRYLERVYAAVRSEGGLAIADEVQVGFGRLGDWFWGFQQQGVVPDVVAVAKSIGAGHPIGAVITRREIADRYRTQGYFFSSTGGSPVSCAVGMAVLDVIRDEQLQENARTVGAHLKQRLEELGDTHALVGQVHGSGLYLGLEFVRDRTTLEPATEETAAICDRLLELGVIMQPTGDHQNVLKIKPPLCVTQESADYFADALDRVLTTGW